MRHFEHPVRLGSYGVAKLTPGGVGFVFALPALIFVMLASVIWAKNTLFWRFSETDFDRNEFRMRQGVLEWEEQNNRFGGLDFDINGLGHRILVIGDSHSQDISASLILANESSFHQIKRTSLINPACFVADDERQSLFSFSRRKPSCEGDLAAIRQNQVLKEATHIVIAHYWAASEIPGLERYIRLLKEESQAKIIHMGQNAVFDKFDRSVSSINKPVERINADFYRSRSRSAIENNKRLREIARSLGVPFVDRQSIVCNGDAASCAVVNSDRDLLYRDRHHWTAYGRRQFGPELLRRVEQEI